MSHDSSEIILICWFLIIINIENSCAASYFCGNHNTFAFKGLESVSTLATRQQWPGSPQHPSTVAVSCAWIKSDGNLINVIYIQYMHFHVLAESCSNPDMVTVGICITFHLLFKHVVMVFSGRDISCKVSYDVSLCLIMGFCLRLLFCFTFWRTLKSWERLRLRWELARKLLAT